MGKGSWVVDWAGSVLHGVYLLTVVTVVMALLAMLTAPVDWNLGCIIASVAK